MVTMDDENELINLRILASNESEIGKNLQLVDIQAGNIQLINH